MAAFATPPTGPRLFFRSRMLVPVGVTDSFRIERVISLARLVLAVIALISLAPDASTGAPLTGARVLLVLFVAHSAAALLVLRSQPGALSAFGLVTHGIDMLAAALTLPVAALTNQF